MTARGRAPLGATTVNAETEHHLDLADVTLDLISVTRSLYQLYGEAGPSYHAVWQAAASGRIPAYRVGRAWRVPEAEMEQVARYFGLPPASPPAPTSRTPDKPAAA
jgi:excisionase family DNA binding protein